LPIEPALKRRVCYDQCRVERFRSVRPKETNFKTLFEQPHQILDGYQSAYFTLLSGTRSTLRSSAQSVSALRRIGRRFEPHLEQCGVSFPTLLRIRLSLIVSFLYALIVYGGQQ
jgi:hypothetical protein